MLVFALVAGACTSGYAPMVKELPVNEVAKLELPTKENIQSSTRLPKHFPASTGVIYA